MDTQHACLSKIVLEGEILPFIDAKIGPQFFTDPKHLQVWELISDHYKQHAKPPSEGVVHKAYPTYTFTDYPEPTDYYLNQLRQDRTKVILTEGVQLYAERLAQEEGPNIGEDLELILRRTLNEAAYEITQGRDTDFFLSRERYMERLQARIDNPGYLRGITTGFDGLDRITGGLQAEQLITLIGTPKGGKSSTILKVALTARLQGAHVLFFTFEMSTEEQEDRLVSLLSGVSLNKILSGFLSQDEVNKIDSALRLRERLAGFIITADTSSAMNLSSIQAKVSEHRPDLVCIDGVYLMQDERGEKQGSPQALTNITRGLKRAAQVNRIPYLISTQALISRSRGGLTTDSIGYSSSFGQDSDVVLGVEQHEDVENVSRLKVLAIRSGPKGEVFMVFDWDKGDIRELTRTDYEAAADDPVDGAKVKPKAPSLLDSMYEEDDEDAA